MKIDIWNERGVCDKKYKLINELKENYICCMFVTFEKRGRRYEVDIYICVCVGVCSYTLWSRKMK